MNVYLTDPRVEKKRKGVRLCCPSLSFSLSLVSFRGARKWSEKHSKCIGLHFGLGSTKNLFQLLRRPALKIGNIDIYNQRVHCTVCAHPFWSPSLSLARSLALSRLRNAPIQTAWVYISFYLAQKSLRNAPIHNALVYISFCVARRKSDNRALGHDSIG